MKVLTKVVSIEGQEFVLVSDERNDTTYYGTIPYSELDENGMLKRELNGHEMCISLESVGAALENRTKRIMVDKYEAEGHTKAEVLMFILNGYSTEGWDQETFDEVKALA